MGKNKDHSQVQIHVVLLERFEVGPIDPCALLSKQPDCSTHCVAGVKNRSCGQRGFFTLSTIAETSKLKMKRVDTERANSNWGCQLSDDDWEKMGFPAPQTGEAVFFLQHPSDAMPEQQPKRKKNEDSSMEEDKIIMDSAIVSSMIENHPGDEAKSEVSSSETHLLSSSFHAPKMPFSFEVAKDAPFPEYSLQFPPSQNLNNMYQKREYKGKTSECFFTWSTGPKHRLQFTSIFVDPQTKEVFPAGRYNEEETKCTVDEEGTVWYSSKKRAIDGAAARVVDCLHFRQGWQNTLFSPDPPYAANDAPPEHSIPMPEHIQEALKIKKERLDEETRVKAEQDAEMVELPDMMLAEDREEYRESRIVQ